ncbi:MAG: hypothetical protein KDB34_02495 [Propionibacteriaceae bacterium]|uniref:Uncharacterized protein n=1 Tax=Brooklawnia propionicigenes TaxID=3041175 RepID=A0AAN0K7V1_9ACTN|nr:hypothetical protein [Propionibacteriaceae bacterium]BEH03378.1 hypothetical protein brsh051_26590 [Brooklawnia sp. SH051]
MAAVFAVALRDRVPPDLAAEAFFVRALGLCAPVVVAAPVAADAADSLPAAEAVAFPVRFAGAFSAGTASVGCSLTFVLRVRAVFTNAPAA